MNGKKGRVKWVDLSAQTSGNQSVLREQGFLSPEIIW